MWTYAADRNQNATPLQATAFAGNANLHHACLVLSRKIYKCETSDASDMTVKQADWDAQQTPPGVAPHFPVRWQPVAHDHSGERVLQGAKSGTGCQWAIYERPHPQTYFIVFRGSSDRVDWQTNAALVKYGESALPSVLANEALRALDQLPNSATATLVFTGHSLGGNNALYAREKYHRNMRLATYIDVTANWRWQKKFVTTHEWRPHTNHTPQPDSTCITFASFVSDSLADMLHNRPQALHLQKATVWSTSSDPVWRWGRYCYDKKEQGDDGQLTWHTPHLPTADTNFPTCHKLRYYQLFA